MEQSEASDEAELERTTKQLLKALGLGGRGELVVGSYLEGAGLRGDGLVASLLVTLVDRSIAVYGGRIREFTKLDAKKVGRAVSLTLEVLQTQCENAKASRGLGSEDVH